MDLEAFPFHVPFLTVPDIEVVGRGDHERRRREALLLAPPEASAVGVPVDVEVLDPDPAEDVDGGHGAEVVRGIGAIDGVE